MYCSRNSLQSYELISHIKELEIWNWKCNLEFAPNMEPVTLIFYNSTFFHSILSQYTASRIYLNKMILEQKTGVIVFSCLMIYHHYIDILHFAKIVIVWGSQFGLVFIIFLILKIKKIKLNKCTNKKIVHFCLYLGFKLPILFKIWLIWPVK